MSWSTAFKLPEMLSSGASMSSIPNYSGSFSPSKPGAGMDLAGWLNLGSAVLEQVNNVRGAWSGDPTYQPQRMAMDRFEQYINQDKEDPLTSLMKEILTQYSSRARFTPKKTAEGQTFRV